MAARRANWKTLFQGIQSSPLLKEHLTPVIATENTEPSWFGFPIHCSQGLDREKLVAFLEERKVGPRLVFDTASLRIGYSINSTLKNRGAPTTAFVRELSGPVAVTIRRVPQEAGLRIDVA